MQRGGEADFEGSPEARFRSDADLAAVVTHRLVALGEDEIRRAIEAFVAREGLSGPRGIGPVMKAMIAHFGGNADGKTINQIARQVLG